MLFIKLFSSIFHMSIRIKKKNERKKKKKSFFFLNHSKKATPLPIPTPQRVDKQGRMNECLIWYNGQQTNQADLCQ